jgi:hypothetical protein
MKNQASFLLSPYRYSAEHEAAMQRYYVIMHEGQKMGSDPVEIESKLIPIMREGVDVIKMIFFKQVKEYLLANDPAGDIAYCGRLAGSVINALFGTGNPAEPFASFAEANRNRIDRELENIPLAFEEMRIPLSDSLRVQFLCDSMEGFDSSAILLHDRPVPLPKNFLELVRRLGKGHNLLIENLMPPGEA